MILAVVFAFGCNESADGGPDLFGDASSEVWWQGNNGDLTEAGDDDILPEDQVAREEVREPEDLGPENTPPAFAALSPLTLDMGTSTTLDLNPFIADEEDSDDMLVLEWSADHVALQDPGDHLLLVVAPVDWDGAEVITITVIDTGGLEASADLKVVVNKVEEPEPLPPDKCGEVVFSFEADESVQEVMLSGSFNDWGKIEPNYLMEDPDGDHVFEKTMVLDPGAYQYKFVVDGDWITDPKNPNKVDDGFGGSNSVLEVLECEE